jgi:hypothetical protein
MWNILIVIIIAIIIFAVNPFKGVSFKQSVQQEQKTKSEAQQVLDQTQQQVDYARQVQQQEQQAPQ